MSAEYIMSEGNENVILCELGIRTFETYTRNTLDVSAIPAVKQMSHLPVVVDPSHAAGMYWMVEPWPWPPWPPAPTASSSRSTTTPPTPSATASSPSPPRNRQSNGQGERHG